MLDYDLKPRELRSPISVIIDAKYRYKIVLVVKCAQFCSAYATTYTYTAVIADIYVRQVLSAVVLFCLHFCLGCHCIIRPTFLELICIFTVWINQLLVGLF